MHLKRSSSALIHLCNIINEERDKRRIKLPSIKLPSAQMNGEAQPLTERSYLDIVVGSNQALDGVLHELAIVRIEQTVDTLMAIKARLEEDFE